jgi:hypothetical protein
MLGWTDAQMDGQTERQTEIDIHMSTHAYKHTCMCMHTAATAAATW